MDNITKVYFYSCSIITPWYRKNILKHGTINISSPYIRNHHESITELHRAVADRYRKETYEVVLLSTSLLAEVT